MCERLGVRVLGTLFSGDYHDVQLAVRPKGSVHGMDNWEARPLGRGHTYTA